MPGYCEVCTCHHLVTERHLEPLRTGTEWCDRTGITIMVPDGWDRRNFEESWAEPITRHEFRRRASVSTASDPNRWLARS